MDCSMQDPPVHYQLPEFTQTQVHRVGDAIQLSSSVVPFSSCIQSFPSSGSFPTSQFFALGGQRIGVSASASVLPMNIQDWFPLGWTGWISLQSKGLSRNFSNITVQKYQFFGTQHFPGDSDGKASACNTGDPGSIPGLGRSPGEGKGNPLQYSCLENPRDRGAWQATVHGVAKSRTRLSHFTSLHFLYSPTLISIHDYWKTHNFD